jgi:hypothetical protein
MPRQDHTSGPLDLTGVATLPAVLIAAGAITALDAPVIGAGLRGSATACPRAALDLGLLIAYVWVSAAGHVTVAVLNPTAAAITPAAAIVIDVMVKNIP